MKILVLSFYYEPDLSAGSFRSTSLVKALRKRLKDNDEIDVITTMPNRYQSFQDTALPFQEEQSIKIYRINLGSHKSGFVDQSLLFGQFALKVINIVRKKEKYDLIYVSSGRLMTAFLGSLISNYQKSKLFLDLRDIFTDTLASLFAKSKLRYIVPLFRQIEKYTVNSADHINLVSQGFEEHFKKINPNMSYSFYPNGIDDEFLSFDFTKEKSTPKKIITYAGNIGEGQGLDKIIPAMAQFLGDAYQIQVVGDGGTKRKLLDALQGVLNVEILPPVSRIKLLEIYKNSDYLFLHLNDYDAFKKVLPSKMFEYAATKKPMIAGVSGYAQEFITQYLPDTILFEPCNVDDFAKKFHLTQEEKPMSEREDFIKKFSRVNIMHELSKRVYEL